MRRIKRVNKKNLAYFMSMLLVIQILLSPLAIVAEMVSNTSLISEEATTSSIVVESISESATETITATLESSSDELEPPSDTVTPPSTASSETTPLPETSSEETTDSEPSLSETSVMEESVDEASETPLVNEPDNTTPENTLASETVSVEKNSSFAPAAEEDFVTTAVDGGLKITDWTGTGTSVQIPDTIGGVPVVAIGSNAFQNFGLTDVSLGKNVKTIEPYGFADNRIATLNIPADSALEEIGEYGFIDNLLTSFTFPTNLKTLGKGAFSDNTLTSITSNAVITTIGDLAFEKNKLSDVSLGNSITTFGAGVFADNGRYVRVTTDNPVIPELEKIDGRYGHVIGAIRVVLKYVDKTTGEELRSPKTVGDDMTHIDNIFVIGQEVSVKPEAISGYAIQDEILFTPDKDLYELTLEYVSTTIPPVIDVIKPAEIPLNTTVEELEAVLLSLVKATDAIGTDITADVTVDPGDLKPTQEGTYEVTYTVTDQYGNVTSKTVDVLVGTDWLKRPIGGDWVLGDYEYAGTMVLGFSEQGIAKLLAMPAGERHIVLPDVSPYGNHPPITIIGKPQDGYNRPGTFAVPGAYPYDSIDFSRTTEVTRIIRYTFHNSRVKELIGFNNLSKLVTIEEQAFGSHGLTSLSFDGLTSLQVIGSNAFSTFGTYAGEPLRSLDLSGATALTTIGGSAFTNHKSLTSLTFGELPLLKSIGSTAFQNIGSSATPLENLDLSGLSGLETIGTTAFNGVYTKSFDISGMTSLTTIGKSAFRNISSASVVDLSQSSQLQLIDEYAFTNSKVQELHLPSPSSLNTIGSYAFQNNALTSLDLSRQMNLKTIGAFAFDKNKMLTTLTMPESGALLESIQSGAFQDVPVTEFILADYPNFKLIQAQYFNSSALTTVEFRNLPSLVQINNHSFGGYHNLTSLKFTDLPSFTTIGDGAFYNPPTRINPEPGALQEVFIHNAPVLSNVSASAFQYNVGHPDYNDLVVLWVTPEDEVLISSKGNYLVNPDKTAEGDWNSSDFVYADINGLRTITGFSETGAGKHASGLSPVVFPEKDPDGNFVQAIGNGAFQYSGIKEADLSNMSQLKLIDNFSFAYNDMTAANLSGLTNLETIGDYAFNGNKLTSLDFSDLGNVKTIRSYAFANNELASADFSGLESVQTFGEAVFAHNKLTSLDLSPLQNLTEFSRLMFYGNTKLSSIHFGEMPNITRIGSSAFGLNDDMRKEVPIAELDLSGLVNLELISDAAFKGQYIESVNFLGLSKLKRIMNSAFMNNRLTSLDLSPLVSLETLDDGRYHSTGYLSQYNTGVFRHNQIESINFGDLPNLTKIGSYAFSNNQLSYVDLSTLPSLTTLPQVFWHNKLVEAKISDNVTTLTAPFDKNDPDGAYPYVYIPVMVRTESGNNPNAIPDRIVPPNGGHYIDPKIITIHYVDTDGNQLLQSETLYDTTAGATSIELVAPEIPAYVARETSHTIV